MAQTPKAVKSVKSAKVVKTAAPAKKSVAAKSKKEVSLPGREEMLAFVKEFGRKRALELTDDAQDLIFDAYEASTKREALALVKKALKCSPLCSDAYSFLAQFENSSAVVRDCYQKAVDAGEIVLGPKAEEEYGGHYWGFIETRPYMRALAGLAGSLQKLDEVEEAIRIYEHMLELNPNDNQGVRYVLMLLWLKLGENVKLKKLLKEYEEDNSCFYLYTKALVSFRDGRKQAEKIAKLAFESNAFIPEMLLQKRPLVEYDTYLSFGGEDEASYYIEHNGQYWLETQGGIQWLGKLFEAHQTK